MNVVTRSAHTAVHHCNPGVRISGMKRDAHRHYRAWRRLTLKAFVKSGEHGDDADLNFAPRCAYLLTDWIVD